ncbi:MAG: DUF952 domain-containing protein [Actinomycetota bacterium]
MTRLIFHITTAPEWAAARTVGSLSPPSLEAEGFVHCSSPTQVTRVADWFYRDVPDLVLLAIDPTRLVSPVRWEPSADVLAGDFPHVYGPITVEAVVRAVPWERDDTGFGLPDELHHLLDG